MRDERVTVAGIVAALRERPTKTGKRMAWVTLEDLTGSIELVCFPAKEAGRSVMGKDGRWSKTGPKPGYENWETLLKGDEPILVRGSVQFSSRDEEQPTAEIIAEEVQSLREVREKRVKRLELRVSVEAVTEDRLQRLVELVQKNPGPTPMALSIELAGEAEAVIGTTSFKVMVSDELLGAVDKLFGAKVAELA
jgi:DNA polymerase-3 subunit alpha